jgi:tagatose 1,6-diphosphate aldolase
MTDAVGSRVSGADDAELGRRRRLLRLADDQGIVVGLALDHRDSFRAALDRRGLTGMATPAIAALKAALVGALAPAASALMLDIELGLEALSEGAVPARIGLIMPLEAQGYEQLGDSRTTSLLPDFSPAAALALGADACKVLLPIRPDRAEALAAQLDLVARSVEAAHAAALPLVVEPTVYRLTTENEADYRSRFTGLVLEAVSSVARLGPDLLKVQFPVSEMAGANALPPGAEDACRGLDRAAAGIPWVLLGAGVSPETFGAQLRAAGAAGASGFLAGRTIWFDALIADPVEAARLARDLSRPRFEEYRAIAREVCRPLG